MAPRNALGHKSSHQYARTGFTMAHLDGTRFTGKVYTEHSQFFSKVVNAKNHGARGVILINDRASHRGDVDQLESFGKTAGPADGGIPFVQIKAEVAERWISGAGKNLDDIAAEIDKDLKPRSFPLPGVEVMEDVDVERAK